VLGVRATREGVCALARRAVDDRARVSGDAGSHRWWLCVPAFGSLRLCAGPAWVRMHTCVSLPFVHPEVRPGALTRLIVGLFCADWIVVRSSSPAHCGARKPFAVWRCCGSSEFEFGRRDYKIARVSPDSASPVSSISLSSDLPPRSNIPASSPTVRNLLPACSLGAR
jgi:hypothetical protein